MSAVDLFSKAMKLKMLKKANQGWKGWDDKDFLPIAKERLKEHLEKGDMVDVANFAMMVWYLEKD